MSDTPSADSTPFLFYCDMAALSPDERTAHQERIAQLFGSLVRETRELPDGYAYRFDGEQYPLLAAFISDERKCCPFVRYTLEVEPHHGPFWLHMTGGDGVKAFLRMAFESANLLNAEAARAAGFSVAGRSAADSAQR